ncbi:MULTISPECIES: DUF2087 domain-containing protein [Brevibacterium]|uniref:DUF2087 domain-containing protein n=1 Tax=Brevibacterium casei TaxID=33889 RepID=A0A7T4DI22_9MICO|nr:DUF2087 domain-containing protein [Brevibacterium casei]QQB13298.1 DUF2087 domain-containing protein [Brevibacterium casei]
MTKNSDFKSLVRERMAQTGENYTSARAALLSQRLLGPASATNTGPAALDPELAAALDAFRAKTRRTFMPHGRLTAIPMKRRALVVLLLDIRDTVDSDRIYTEKEINEHLKQFHADFARLRRELIDYQYLERNPHTGEYWRTDTLPERRGNISQEAGPLEQLPR